MLSSSEKYELKKKFRHLEAEICKTETALDSKADLVDGVVPTSQLPITQDIIDALNNANAPTGINYFTTLADLSSITPGTLINVAANYSALPAANTVSGEFYWVENSQGTSWLPGPLGGTYYPNGLYYSNGTTWIFTDVPFNATQVEVDAGLNNNKFVTPQTLANASKWGTKQDTVTLTTTGTSGAATLTGATLNIPQYQSQLTFDNTPTNGSTNPITSDGVYDALQLKQDTVSLTTTGTSGAATLVGSTLNIPQYQGVLTNPVTGTGTAGQVAYFSGTSAVTGSSSLVWDNATRQLKIAGASGNYTLDLTTTSNSTSIRFEENSVLKSFIQHIGSTFATVNRREFLEISGLNGIAFRTSAEIARFNGGNLLLNSTTDNGQRLQVYGSTLLRGSGTTSATTALLVQNSTPSELFKVVDNGAWNFNGDGIVKGSTNTGSTTALTVQNSDSVNLFRVFNNNNIAAGGTMSLGAGAISVGPVDPTTGFTNITSSGTSLRLGDNVGSLINGYQFYLASPGVTDRQYTSGEGGIMMLGSTLGFGRSYSPTSGNAVFNVLRINYTINQTGGANGITRGLYVNPTLTAAADWRSIEFSNNTGWGIYGAGTANNYLRGGLAIGSRALSFSLTSYNIAITTDLTANGSSIVSDIAVNSGVTTVYGFRSRMFSSTGTYTVSDAYHFSADVTSPDVSSGFTNQYGFYAQSSMTGATNNYGFYGNIASGTGRWNLYMNGTADNYLAGSLGIGTTTIGNNIIAISKALTATTSTSVLSNNEIRSTVSSAYGYRSRMFTINGSYSVSDAYHFAAQVASPAVGSGFTNQYGFIAESSMTDATNNFGFYGNIASGTGRWNLYMNGTAANYLAGNTSIGTAASGGRLTVRGSGTTSATNGLLVEDSGGTDTFTIRDDGGFAFRNGTVGLAQTGYTTFTNLTTDRTCDANATTVDELADILGTLIEDLKTKGIIAA